ncbi:sensor histidine kinase [Paenibacillus sp. KQZ6P-2]|uniref:Sensor histidine kinase n=1 Tax=Paenibacillus mangrovi TaxID=2931978 RepID=A0A9X1WKZ5_9BACL|nr:sensor histidine kinase [Paenibacillus mangrovi]MCJ8010436.1 sensor histidine kinase [Paenibacillus mangrovi]
MNIEKTYKKLQFWNKVYAITNPGRNRLNFNFNLKKKFFLIFLVSSIIPITSFIAYSYFSTRDLITKQSYSSLNETLNQINLNIENRLEYYHKLSDSLYMDSQLRNYLSNNYLEAFYYLDAFNYINSTLSTMLTLNSKIQGITIYTDNKTFYSDGVFVKYMEDIPERVKQEALQAAGDTIYMQLQDEESLDYHITLARSLSYFSLTHPYGILTINIDNDEIYSLIKQESVNKSIYIIDESGTIITAGDKEMVSQSLYDTFPIEDQLQASSGRFEEDIDGQKCFFLFKQLSNGWKSVITVPYSQLMEDAEKSTERIIWISILTIAASIILIHITTKLITKRIEQLLQQIRKVERGDFEVSIQSTSRDEIAQLSFAFNKMASKIQELIHDVYVKEISMKEAELTTLQAQINPHFLYNTLASISSLAIKEGDMQVYQMVNHLSKYYRISLNKGKRIILIEQEINLVKNYISIQEIRFKGMLRMHYDLDETLFQLSTIKLILQPFVENCINHAIWNESGINIIVKLKSYGDDILLQIIDDGMGMTPANLEKALKKTSNNSGYGINNVDERIKLTYGESYGVEIFSRLGIGTSVTVRIPKMKIYEV